MEDVGAVLVNSFSAVVHNQFFLEAARHGTSVIFCEKFRPVAVLLPANRATDTQLTRAQLNLSQAARNALWHKTVTAKCVNQAAFARHLDEAGPASSRLAQWALGPRIDKEARCARLYWQILSRHLDEAAFRRERQTGGLNSLLDYGYTVLLARVLQRMLAVGIDPTFGVGHVVRERATPLAYDLMEPFRAAVDARVVAWARQQGTRPANETESPAQAVTPAFKKWIIGFLELPVPHAGKPIKLERLIEHVLRGFREAVCARRPGAYKPWTLGNTKWDGCS
jgi:CRISPR-associated protein Cas1